jgi:hypothetical protein
VMRLCNAEVSVVSLPQRLRSHPLAWLTVAHETAGHDVLHADPELLPELVDAIRTLFGGGPLTPGRQPDPDQLQALLWSYWIDEVASDVYALLNSGPAFAYNMAAFLEALQVMRPGLKDSLNMKSRFLPLDTHPPGVLRLHVAIGVVKNLANLAAEDRQIHVDNLETLARRHANGASITLQGRVEVDRDRWVDLERQEVPLHEAAGAARRVGAFIATTPLRTFGGHTVQDLETWDANDERVAILVSDAFLVPGGDPLAVKNLGDDAQLLAGATLAVLEDPSRYDAINFALETALDESYRRDPVLGFAFAHPMFQLEAEPVPPDAQPESDPRTGTQDTGVGAPPTPVPADAEPRVSEEPHSEP